MANLQQSEQQLSKAEERLSGYTKELPGQIKAEYEKAWTPALKEATGATERMMGEFLPKFWGLPEAYGGTSESDISAGKKLSLMGGELGTMSGRLVASQRLSDYLGGQMRDLQGKALEAMRFGYEADAAAYAREFQKYQMAWQEAENAKNRAASGGGGGQPDPYGWMDKWTEDETEKSPMEAWKDRVMEAKKKQAQPPGGQQPDISKGLKGMWGR